MAIEHVVTQMVLVQGQTRQRSKTYSAESSQTIEKAITDSTTDEQITIAIVKAQVISLYMQSDQDLQLDYNDAAGAQGTISLIANVPLIWNADSYFSNPLAVDITDFYATNASGSTANLYIEVLEDPTP